MADVPIRHWPAARLRHVADQHRADTRRRKAMPEPLDVVHQVGMTEVAIALQRHGLVADAFGRQLHGPDQAGRAMRADYARLTG